MVVLRGILAFLSYAVLSSFIDWRVAALLAAGVALAIIVWARATGSRPGELLVESCGFAWFVVAAVLAYADSGLGLRHYVGAIGQLVLAGTIVVTLLVRRPFTTPMARREAPESIWHHPAFLSLNTRISAGWALGLGLSGIVLLVLVSNGVHTTWVQVVVIVAGIVLPVAFQRREIAAFQTHAARAFSGAREPSARATPPRAGQPPE